MRQTLLALALGVMVAGCQSPRPVQTVLAVDGRSNANVSLASTGDFVVATWSASVPDGPTDIYAAVSHDAGQTFSEPVQLTSTPGDAQVNGEQPPRVALSGDGAAPAIAVVWTAKGESGTTLRTVRSTDGGRTFSASSLVPDTDAPGNRGWEAIGSGPGDRFFTVWLDHRKLAAPQESTLAGAHHHVHGATTETSAPAPASDGVAMAQLSQLFVAPLDGSASAQAITGGVCYCCKTAIGASGNRLYLAWRHVYDGNMRDIAFTASSDGGRTFSTPVRVSEDQWQINGCPDDGPSMAIDGKGRVHLVWPTLVSRDGQPVKALFHAVSPDGRTFEPREPIPTEGQANHPQLTVNTNGDLVVAWDESGGGSRHIVAAIGTLDGRGHPTFTRVEQDSPQVGSYPVVVPSSEGALMAWTTVPAAGEQSVIRLVRVE
jgi:hypothetical protein